MKKKIIASILIIAFLIAGLWFAQRLLMPKYMGKIVEGAMVEEYYKETTDHDVIFIGDCEVYENFSTMKLWEEYGITSYIRGSSQQLIWQSYYLLEETLKYEKPKVVVFNVLSLKYDKPQKEAYNRMTLDGMKWSGSKVNDIKASMTEDESFIDYVFPILRYHSRWTELTGDDIKYIFENIGIRAHGIMKNDSSYQLLILFSFTKNHFFFARIRINFSAFIVIQRSKHNWHSVDFLNRLDIEISNYCRCHGIARI